MRYFGEIAHRFRVIAHLFPRNSASRLRLDALLPPSRSAISGSRARACARDTAGMRATMHMHACMHCAFAHACRRHTGVAGVVASQLLAPRPSVCIVKQRRLRREATTPATGRGGMHLGEDSNACTYLLRARVTQSRSVQPPVQAGRPCSPCSPYDRACTGVPEPTRVCSH